MTGLLPASLQGTFASLSVRNFRLYMTGQSISLTGTWMQLLGQEWLVLTLTDSGMWLGITAACQFLPMLLLSPFGGLVADRVDKRRLLIITQGVAAVVSITLGVVTYLGTVRLWMVLVLAVALGTVTALDNPTRHSFVSEMVGTDYIDNAVTLWSVLVQAARAVGPAIAGVLIATVGIAWSFLLNGLSFVGVIAALLLMDRGALLSVEAQPRGPGQLREGFRYVWATPMLRSTLLMLAVVGMVAYEFTVTLPLMAQFVFDGDARTLGVLNSALGAGAVLGGILTASRARATSRHLSVLCGVFGVLLSATAFAPFLWTALILLFATGTVSVQVLASTNALLQRVSEPRYRGRVLALWTVAFIGTTPLGAPLVGWVSEWAGPRAGLLLGGVATVIVAAWYGTRGNPDRDQVRPTSFR